MIRALKPSDLPACADIMCSVYNNELWQCCWDKETAIRYLTDFLHMPRFIGYVIEENDEVIGALFAREKVWWNNSEVFIEEMFVQPGKQGKGLGTLLLRQVEAYVQAKGLAGMTLSTNRYAPAPNFYKQNGFADCEHVLFMARTI